MITVEVPGAPANGRACEWPFVWGSASIPFSMSALPSVLPEEAAARSDCTTGDAAWLRSSIPAGLSGREGLQSGLCVSKYWSVAALSRIFVSRPLVGVASGLADGVTSAVSSTMSLEKAPDSRLATDTALRAVSDGTDDVACDSPSYASIVEVRVRAAQFWCACGLRNHTVARARAMFHGVRTCLARESSERACCSCSAPGHHRRRQRRRRCHAWQHTNLSDMLHDATAC
eukprot:2942112-Prymnesium_polylepis.2